MNVAIDYYSRTARLLRSAINHSSNEEPARLCDAPYDFDGDVLSRFVIERSNYLAEASLSYHLQYLVSANCDAKKFLDTKTLFC